MNSTYHPGDFLARPRLYAMPDAYERRARVRMRLGRRQRAMRAARHWLRYVWARIDKTGLWLLVAECVALLVAWGWL